MKRRDLLKVVSAASVAGPSLDSSRAATGDGVSRTEANWTSGAVDCDFPEVSGDATSLGRIACEMDEDRPADRLGGNFPPEFRESEANVPHRTGPYVPVDPQPWNDREGASGKEIRRELNAIRKKRVLDHARDLGLAHRKEKGILELHRYQSGDGAASMEEVARRHREGNEFKLLFLNAALFTPTPVPSIPTQHRDIDQRKQEIGKMLDAEGYDIAGLCEVWFPGQAEAILDNAGPMDNAYRFNDGQIAGNNGLLTLISRDSPGPNDMLKSDHFGKYPNSTPPTGKGWLHTEIDLGPGKIDFFVTHLNHRWDGKRFPRQRQTQLGILTLGPLSNSEVASDENVTIVCGDFNVLGNRAEYDELIRIMDEVEGLNLQDVWLTRGGAVAKTSWFADHHPYWQGDGFIRVSDDGQQTPMADGDAIGGEDEPNWPWSCPGYEEDCNCGTYHGNRKVRRKQDNNVRIDKNARLDYVFVEAPKPEHDMNLDIKRVHRKLFPRIPSDDVHDDPREKRALDCATETVDCPSGSIFCNSEQYLSDHMGLELEIIASPA